MFQGQFHHFLFHFLRDAVPDLVRVGTMVYQPFLPFFQIFFVPAIEGTARHLQFCQGLLHTQGRMLHDVDYLSFLRFAPADHSSHFIPLPSKLFLSLRLSNVSSATTTLSCSFSARISFTSWLSASRRVSPTKRCFPASKNSLLHL